MAPRRQAPARKSVCPACDAAIPLALATEPSPRCPACEQVLTPVRVAGLWRRAAAGTVDGVVLALSAGLLNWGLLQMLDLPPLLGQARGLDAALRVLDLSAIAVLGRMAPALAMIALYEVLFWSAVGRTPGQRLLRIRVVGKHGQPPRPLASVVRAIGQAAACLPGGLGLLWIAFDREKRGWHDHLAGTWVVREA